MAENSAPSPAEWNKKLQQDAAASAFQLVMQLIRSGWKWAETADKWEAAAAQYVKRWIDRWGQIKPLGADHPIPLHQIFVHVRAVPRSFLQRFASIEEMEAAVHKGESRCFFALSQEERKTYEPQPGMRIANEYARLNVLGAPGAGKSTFLRRLGLEALLPRDDSISTDSKWKCKSEYEHPLLPVLLELRSLRARPITKPDDLLALLVEEFANAGFPASERFVDTALKKGDLLILLDGVDEIPTAQLDSSVTAIRDFISRFPDCRYVLSCRSAFYRDWFTGFHDFVLADFDNDQIAHFAHNWFTRPEDREADAANTFLELLLSDEHRATQELAGSPLLLTFLCLVFRKTQQFPPNRAQLYQKALRIFLEEWNASKLVHNDAVYKDLSPEMELEMLKDIAGPAFIENRYFFTGDELTASIGRFLERELNAPKSLSPGQILDAIAIQQGLFIERAQNIWTFSHLTIQEYLAAAWIIQEGMAIKALETHMGENRWSEVFLLLAGLGRSDDLLRTMMRHAESMISDQLMISELFETLSSIAHSAWKDAEASGNGEKFIEGGQVCGEAILRLAVLRAMRPRYKEIRAVKRHGSVLNTSLSLCISFLRSFSSYIELIIGSDKTHSHVFVLDSDDSYAMCECTLEHLEESLQDAMQDRNLEDCKICDFRLERLSPSEDFDVLSRYLSTWLLICECKEAALRVSREVWTEVCSRFLVPPNRLMSTAD